MRVKLTGPNGNDRTEEIVDFAKTIGLDRITPWRYSVLLVLGLYGGQIRATGPCPHFL